MYDDLRRRAHAHLRQERPDHILQTTALVHLRDLYNVGNQGAAKVRADSAQRTVDYLDRLAAAGGSDIRLQEDLAEAYRTLGNFRSDPLHTSLGDAATALTNFEKAARILEPLAAAYPTNERLLQLLLVYEATGLALLPINVAASLEAQHRTVATAERRVRAQPDNPVFILDYANAVRLAGERLGHPYYGNVGDTDSALREIARSAKLIEQWFLKADAPTPDLRGYTDAILAGMLWATGALDEAIAVQRRAIRATESLMMQLPDRTDVRAELGLMHVRTANFLNDAGHGVEDEPSEAGDGDTRAPRGNRSQ